MPGERVSRVDHAWLRMDDPFNWMVITGLMTFDAPLDEQQFKALVERMTLHYPRFRQRLSRSLFTHARPSWEDDPDFDLNNHIESIHLPQPANKAMLEELISLLMSYGLDYSRPLWQFYLVENYGTGSAMIVRLHHCLADGIALVQILLSLTNTTPEMPASLSSADPSTGKTPNQEKGFLDFLPAPLKAPVRVMRSLAHRGRQALSDPEYAFEQAQLLSSIGEAAARLALRWPDPKTLYKGPLGKEKRAAWSEPLPLKDFKRVGYAFGATINDVILSALSGALRQYLLYRQSRADGLRIRAVIPVNLRTQEQVAHMGNRFGLVFVTLPIDINDPLERLHAVRHNMDKIKATPEALTSFGILGLLGSLPGSLQKVGVNIFDTKGTAIITNVPGPGQQLYLAGAPINTLMAWVPQSGRVGLGISIISYNGKVWLGVNGDQSRVPDPQRIVDNFVTEFLELNALAVPVLAQRHSSIQPMLDQLDEALHTLDEFLSQEASSSTGVSSQIARCQASTRTGLPCKNTPQPGKSYCRLHEK